jgi:hypothetical protein
MSRFPFPSINLTGPYSSALLFSRATPYTTRAQTGYNREWFVSIKNKLNWGQVQLLPLRYSLHSFRHLYPHSANEVPLRPCCRRSIRHLGYAYVPGYRFITIAIMACTHTSPSSQEGSSAAMPTMDFEVPSIPASPDPSNGKRRNSQGDETNGDCNGDEGMLEAESDAVHLGQGSLYVAARL